MKAINEANERQRIGAIIQSIRVEKKLTQQQLAKKVDMIQTTISKIESGKFSASIDILSKICTALDCKIDIVKVAQ